MSYIATCPDCGAEIKFWYVGSSLTNEHRIPGGPERCQKARGTQKPRCAVCGGLNPGDITHTSCASNGYEGLG